MPSYECVYSYFFVVVFVRSFHVVPNAAICFAMAQLQIYWNAVPYLSPFQYPHTSLYESERAADEARTAQKEKEAERQRQAAAAAAAAATAAAIEDQGAAVAEAPVPAAVKASSRRAGYDPKVRPLFILSFILR